MQRVKRLPMVDGDLGWYETSTGRDRRLGRRLKGDHVFDVAIVGAGYSGLSVAHRLAELHPDMRVALVDALQVGQGTSGRNSGFMIDLPHNLDAAASDVAHDRQLYQLNTFAIERLRQFKDQHQIDCSWHDAGKYMAAHERHNQSGLDNFVNTLRACGFEYEVVEGAALERRLGTNYYRSAVYTPGNVLINPAALVRGLAAVLPPSVTLFEESPVLSCEYGSPHLLQCLGGSIRARTLVLATNSYNEQFGLMSNRLAPVFTYASLTERLSDADYNTFFKDVKPWGITSAHPAGSTVRLTPDRRLFIRNVLDFEPELRSTQEGLRTAWMQHRRSFEARFPKLSKMVFEYTWGGMLCMTMNHQPLFTKGADEVYMIGGCNGVGVVKGTYLGYYMAEYMNGIDSKELRFIQKTSNPSWVPPDPMRTIGARIRLKYETNRAGGDV